jgi:hypothetical protein
VFSKPPKWGWEWTLNAFLVVVTAILGIIGMVSDDVWYWVALTLFVSHRPEHAAGLDSLAW